jgi:TRAP-type C4-dicarboxylate transport system permease small subunit
MKLAGAAFDWIVNALAVVASLLLIAMMLATVFKVGLRGVAGQGIIGIDQLSGTAMVYMTFLGGAWVLRNNGHVTLDLVLSSARAEVKRKLIILNSLIGAAVCFTLSYYGFATVQVSIARGVVVATELEIPRAIGLIPIPLGALILGIEFLRRALTAYHGEPEPSDDLSVEA